MRTAAARRPGKPIGGNGDGFYNPAAPANPLRNRASLGKTPCV